jgi:hypothetical protein
MGGKFIKSAAVDTAFTTKGGLSPDSCGWHYVEGLREGDPQDLALVWDKTRGLDHHGMRRANIEHEVISLDGSRQFISPAAWPNFCATQRMLIAEVITKRSATNPPIRWSDEAALGPNKFPPPTISKTK